MNPPLSQIVERYVRHVASIEGDEHDIEAALSAKPLSDFHPVESYVLVALLKHERRQMWVGFVIGSRLRASGQELAHHGSLGHPEGIDQMGEVPGEPGWRYFFHGRGCCFTHEDGTSIDVDFADDGSPLEIDPFFYQNYLDSAPSLEWCERQLIAPQGLEEWWQVSLGPLEKLGLIDFEHRLRLTDRGRLLAEAIEPLLDAIENSRPSGKALLLIGIGDCVAAANELKLSGLHVPLLEAKAAAQTSTRIAMLRRMLAGQAAGSSEGRFIYAALAIAADASAVTDLRATLLSKPVNGWNHIALAGLRRLEGDHVTNIIADAFLHLTHETWIGRIRRMIHGQPSGPELPWFSLVVALVKVSLKRQTPGDTFERFRQIARDRLRSDFGASDDEAAFLLFLLDPKEGLKKLQGALQHHIPAPRMGAAAFLAMIDDADSIAILIAAAEGNPESGGHEAACALSLIESDRAKAAASHWQRKHDGYEDPGEGQPFEFNGRTFSSWSMDDLMRSNLRDSVRYELESKRKRYVPLLERWQFRSKLR